MQNLYPEHEPQFKVIEGGCFSSGFDTDDLQEAINPTRAKMLKLFGEALTQSNIAHMLTKLELAAVMEDMDDALSDALGTSPLWSIAQRNERRES